MGRDLKLCAFRVIIMLFGLLGMARLSGNPPYIKPQHNFLLSDTFLSFVPWTLFFLLPAVVVCDVVFTLFEPGALARSFCSRSWSPSRCRWTTPIFTGSNCEYQSNSWWNWFLTSKFPGCCRWWSSSFPLQSQEPYGDTIIICKSLWFEKWRD